MDAVCTAPDHAADHSGIFVADFIELLDSSRDGDGRFKGEGEGGGAVTNGL